MADDALGQLLTEQVAYYRALAPEYLDGVLDLPGGEEIEAALDVFAPAGDVLELACGPGSWTPRLLQDATTVTAVDAAPEMLAIARDAVGDDDRELVEGAASSTIRRRLRDGSAYRAVKVPHRPHALERRLAELGWDIRVSSTAGPFFSGAGGRATRDVHC